MARVAGWIIVAVLFAVGPATLRADVVAERAELYASYGEQLEGLAQSFEKQQWPDAAEELRAWLPSRAADHLTLFVLPPTASPPKSPPKSAEWRRRWQAIRDQQADALVALARQAVSEHHPSIALELVTEAVRENPDHKQARRVLGYLRFRDAWHTPFEVKQLSAGKVWTEKFGWLPKGHVDRYTKGERHYRGRWMRAAEEAQLRRDLKHGWRVESDHYVITTNHSLEEGVRLAVKLESLYDVWRQVFISYLASEAELARMFEGRVPKPESRQHNVVYYRTREEYNEALRRRQPQIEVSLGIYFATEQTAYFFAGDDQEPGTLYHEATHQLFHECRDVVSEVARDSNFWVIEGVACYMETLTEGPVCCTLGGDDAGRMPAARQRLLDGYYVPLAQLVRLGMSVLQRDSQLPKLYGQAAALTDFLMHDSGGRYRDALVRYLDAIYSGRADTHTLAQVTGTDYDTLDRQFREFMQPAAPAQADPAEATTGS